MRDVERTQRVRSLIRSGLPTRLIAVVLDMEEPTGTAWTEACSAEFARQLRAELATIEDRMSCLALSRDTIQDYLNRTAGT